MPKVNEKQAPSFRSNCPINYSLELFGDAWSLLIIRDIVYFGKKTFSEFLASNEGIARNILSNRLSGLIHNGILIKKAHPNDKRKEVYGLTEKGLDIIPLLLDMAEWGATYYQHADAPSFWIELVRSDRANMLRLIRRTVQDGSAIFVGDDSVISKIAQQN